MSLVKPQKGLSIPSLWVNISIFKVNPIFIPPVPPVLWVQLNWDPNFDQNRIFSRLNAVNLHVFNRCPQIDHNSSKFHHFSSSLNTMDDHPMKKSCFTKTIIFFSLQRGIDHRNETTTAFL